MTKQRQNLNVHEPFTYTQNKQSFIVFGRTISASSKDEQMQPTAQTPRKRPAVRLNSVWQCAINVHRMDSEARLVHTLLTLPISEVHDTTMVLGTVVDSRMREVIFMGRLGLFGSTPFFVGGRYPCSQNQTNMWLCFLATWNDWLVTISVDSQGDYRACCWPSHTD